MKFDGSSGRKPSTEARRYIYSCLAAVIDMDRRWFFEGVDDEFDRRRLENELAKVRAELLRKRDSK